MSVKHIALIETRAVKTHVFSRVYLPRLGVAILSGVLRKAGYNVEIFYQDLKPIDLNDLLRFDLVGISSISSTVTEGYRIGAFLKEQGVPVVMGGPHVSAMAEEALERCDYVVRGEGEMVFLKLLAALDKGAGGGGIPGVSFKQNGAVIHNPSAIEKVDLDSLPVSDFAACKGFAGPHEYPPIVMCSRGCPYDCNFCNVTITFGKKYRYRSTPQILRDLEPFLGRSVCFIDDNFAAIPNKTKELLRAMIDENKIPLRYSCQIRINAARDEELLELMRRTRVRIAYTGLESVNPETLKQYKKGQTLEQIVAAIKTFRKYGIGLHGMFVLGGETDTKETIRETVDFALDAGLDTIQLCALTPFPGTAIHDDMKREKRILHQNWEKYDGHHVVIQPAMMTPYELQRGIMDELKRFYSIRNISRLSLSKRWRLKYRIGGRHLVNQWLTANAGYFDYLKEREAQPQRSVA